MEGAPHLGYFEMLGQIPEKIEGVHIITGCESNIVNIEGAIDLPSDIQSSLNLVMAGLHKRTPFPDKTNSAQNTEAIINAIRNNRVHIISHPYRPEFPTNIEKICTAAIERNVLLELNLSLLERYSFSTELLEQIDLMIKLTEENGRKLVISSDCHISTKLGDDSILKRLKLEIPRNLILGEEGGYQEIQDFLNNKNRSNI
jgi:putative hydrolase